MSEASAVRAKQTFWSLQAGRGFAAVLVVMHHCSAYFGTDQRFWRHAAYSTLFRFGALGVNFFFVLSGIVILLAHRRDLGNPQQFILFWRKRFLRIYPIYWVVLALVSVAFLLRPDMGQSYQHSGWVTLSSVLLIHINSVAATLSVAWSLFAELVFYFVFSLGILSKPLGLLSLSLWFAVCGLQVVHPVFGGAVLNVYVSPWHLLFGCGMLTAFLVVHPRAARLPDRSIVGVGGGLMLVACAWCDLRGPKVVPVYLFGGLASAVLLMGVMLREKAGHIPVPPWLTLLGDASYSIYLIHFPLLSVITRTFYKASQRMPLVPLPLWFLLESAVAVAVGLTLHLYVERPLLRIGGALILKST